MTTKVLRDQKYNWVSCRAAERFYDVGILADGTLHNPNGYSADEVRAAVLAANERRAARRSEAAKRATKTRIKRQEKKTYFVVDRILTNQPVGPRSNCYICGRGLHDPPSIARGIGSECWQGVLAGITRRNTESAA